MSLRGGVYGRWTLLEKRLEELEAEEEGGLTEEEGKKAEWELRRFQAELGRASKLRRTRRLRGEGRR